MALRTWIQGKLSSKLKKYIKKIEINAGTNETSLEAF